MALLKESNSAITMTVRNWSQQRCLLEVKKEGELIRYHQNGKMMSKSFYKNDVMEGTATFYFKNGYVQSKVTYKNGELNRPAYNLSGHATLRMERKIYSVHILTS